MLGVTILGNNSAVPAFNRHPTAQIISLRNELFLVDCGEGTQMQINKYKIRKSRITRIFISHLHGDHYFGLIGLLTSMNLLGRTEDMHIYAPPLLQSLLALHCKMSNSAFLFKLHFYPLTKAEKIVDDEQIEVSCFPTKHSIECWGFLFKEKKIKRRIDIIKANIHSIPINAYKQLQQGKDYIKEDGTCIANELVTIPGNKLYTYAYCADTLYDEDLLTHIKDVDVLYHETTYLHEMVNQAKLRFHSTTKQAALIAEQANIKHLLIGHFSSKYENVDTFLNEAQTVFSNTSLALEGVTYRINIY